MGRQRRGQSQVRPEVPPEERWTLCQAKDHQKDGQGNEGQNEESQRYRQGKGRRLIRQEEEVSNRQPFAPGVVAPIPTDAKRRICEAGLSLSPPGRGRWTNLPLNCKI